MKLIAISKWRLKDDSYWYRYIYPKNLTLFQNEKLVAPEISLGGNFAYDEKGGFYSTTKIYGYIKNGHVNEGYKFWLGLLNSELFWFFIKETGYVLRGGYYTFKTNYILPFPVPSKIPTETVSLIENLVDSILTLRHANVSSNTKQLENEIDNLVYEIYDLNATEIDVVKRSIY